MRSSFLAAAVQVCAGPDKKLNLDRAASFVREAAKQGGELVVLPEVFSWRGARADEASSAEKIPGPTTRRLSALARKLKIHLLAGSILERSDDSGRAFNTSLLFDPSGERVATYRKIHLFDVDIPGHVTIRESDTRRPGNQAVVARTALGTIGMSVCYDLRFPELYRLLVRLGAQILCVPAAFTFPTGAAHWEILVRARAIENQCWVIAPNQIGKSSAGVVDFGHSMIVDPWGTPTARASNGEGVIFSKVDLDYLRRVRRELPCLDHSRIET